MTKTIVNTPDAPGSASHGTFPYSQAVVAGGLVFVSGQGPFDPATGSIVGSTIQEQTRQVLRNCDAILRAGTGEPDDMFGAGFRSRSSPKPDAPDQGRKTHRPLSPQRVVGGRCMDEEFGTSRGWPAA